MLHVKTMLGLGDAFAARPTIAALVRKRDQDDIVLETPWPQVFHDIVNAERVRFTKPPRLNIRCAQRNVDEYKGVWDPAPEGARTIRLSYTLAPGCKSIPEQIAESAGVADSARYSDLWFGGEDRRADPSPLAVFRIPTIRTEYRNEARNPAPGLVAAAVDEIGGDWIHLNSLDIEDTEFDTPKSKFANADCGQLSIPTCLDLVSRARCVVTPVSWMLWAALAYRTPCLAIWGGYCGPETILGPYAKDVTVVAPEVMCRCFNPKHSCEKSISVERVREAARGMR